MSDDDLDLDLPPAPRRKAYASPLDLIGLPYVRGGVTPENGFDCHTLLAYVRWHWYARLTPIIALPDARLTHTQACVRGIYRALGGKDRVSAWRACVPTSGCAIALGRTRRGRLHHCAVCVGDGALHALENVGVMYTPLERLPGMFARVEYYECN